MRPSEALALSEKKIMFARHIRPLSMVNRGYD